MRSRESRESLDTPIRIQNSGICPIGRSGILGKHGPFWKRRARRAGRSHHSIICKGGCVRACGHHHDAGADYVWDPQEISHKEVRPGSTIDCLRSHPAKVYRKLSGNIWLRRETVKYESAFVYVAGPSNRNILRRLCLNCKI